MSIEERAKDYDEKDKELQNQETEDKKEVVLVSTVDALKSLAHNGRVRAGKIWNWTKPKLKKVGIGLATTAAVVVAADQVSKKIGKSAEVDEPSEDDGIDFVVQFNEDGSIVATPESDETTLETTQEETTKDE